MLAITSQASEAIRGILDDESVPDGAIVRIASAEEGLQLALVDVGHEEHGLGGQRMQEPQRVGSAIGNGNAAHGP